MKEKTARRFLRRVQKQMSLANMGIKRLSASMDRRVKEATRVLLSEKGGGFEK